MEVSADRESQIRVPAAARRFQRYTVMRASHGSESPKLGRELIQGVADAILRAADVVHLPIDPLLIAQRLAMQVRFAPPVLSGQLGKLMPTRGGFIISIYGQEEDQAESGLELGVRDDPALPSLTTRGRFTLAHEIGHTLFYTIGGQGQFPQRLIAAPTDRRAQWREEGLCHDFARALLMPASAQHLVSVEPSANALKDASRHFRVAKEPVVRRLLYDWGMWQSAVVVQVVLSGGQTKTRVFRGGSRKGGSKKVTGPQLDRVLAGLRSPDAVVHVLRQDYGVAANNLLVSRSVVWAIT